MAKIYSDTDTAPIITDILKSSKIEESVDDVIKKLSQGKPMQGTIIFKAVEKILIDKTTEKDACSFLETELNIPQPTAKKVYKDILSKLIPALKIRPVEKINEEKGTTPDEKDLLPKTPIMIKKPLASEEPMKSEPKLPKKQDSYRETV